MQRGTIRRRSPSDLDELLAIERPSQRNRLSSNAPSVTARTTGQPHISAPSNTMGAPSSSNGHAVGSAAAASSTDTGPHSIPETILDGIRSYRPAGTLMYADDKDWVAENDDVVMDGDGDAGGEGVRVPARKQAFGKRMPIDREEIVRLILQGLQDIGYNQAADVLAKESGYTLASPAAEDFQAAILGGRWSEATALLPDLGISSTPMDLEASSSRSSIASGKVKATGHESPSDHAKFLIAEQKYLEYLEAGHQKKALGVLRSELAAAATDSDALHDLSGYMMCLDREDLYERAKWDGAAGISRRQLLERLQEHISPSVMVPSRRLATLLDQARQHQQQSCLYHDDNDPVSLYTDHQCASGSFPTVTTHILADHTDEVWRIEWSPAGDMLASASKDNTVVIWQLKTPEENGTRQYSVVPLHHLKGHRSAVDSLAWSPDGETLMTAAGKQIYLWNVKTGGRSSVQIDHSPFGDTIGNIQWMPDGTQFVVSSWVSNDGHIVFYNTSGRIDHKWTIKNLHIKDFAITPDGTRIIAATMWVRRSLVHNKHRPSISSRPADGSEDQSTDSGYASMDHGLAVIRIAEKAQIIDFANIQSSDVTSVKLSHDGKRILVSRAQDQLQLYGLEPHLQLLRKFVGHVQGKFIIRSGFGAPKDRFILSGSEDGHVYVWQSNATNPIEVLSGHEDTVNAVAWNPVLSRKLFASCSDDATIRIWQPPVANDTGEETSAGEEEGMEL